MATSLKTHLDHFVSSNHKNMVAFADALASFDGAAMEAAIERVMSSRVVTGIANLINSSSAALGEFLDKINRASDGFKLIAGLTATAAGSLLWVEAAAIAVVQGAVAAGLLVVSLKVVAILLMLYGLSIALPAVWRLIRRKLDDEFDKFTELLAE